MKAKEMLENCNLRAIDNDRSVQENINSACSVLLEQLLLGITSVA